MHAWSLSLGTMDSAYTSGLRDSSTRHLNSPQAAYVCISVGHLAVAVAPISLLHHGLLLAIHGPRCSSIRERALTLRDEVIIAQHLRQPRTVPACCDGLGVGIKGSPVVERSCCRHGEFVSFVTWPLHRKASTPSHSRALADRMIKLA